MALSPLGIGHMLGLVQSNQTASRVAVRGRGSSSGHIKNHEVACAPSNRTLNFSIFSMGMQKTSISLSFFLGTRIREVCSFLCLYIYNKTYEHKLPLERGTGWLENSSGKQTYFSPCTFHRFLILYHVIYYRLEK